MKKVPESVCLGVGCLGAPALPFLLCTAYMAFAETRAQRNFDGESVVFLLSLAIGLACIALLPIKIGWRVVLGIVYLPTEGALLLLWSIGHVCARFSACP